MKARHFGHFRRAIMSLEKGECGLAIVTMGFTVGRLCFVFSDETHQDLFTGKEDWSRVSGYREPCFHYVGSAPANLEAFVEILAQLLGEEIEIEEAVR